MTTKKEQAISLKEQGEPLNKIAEVLGVSERTIRRYLSDVAPASFFENNSAVDKLVEKALKRGASKYQLTAMLANEAGEILSSENIKLVHRAIDNSRKRLQYKGCKLTSFVPTMFVHCNDVAETNKHFKEMCEDVYFFIEQKMESFLQNNYDEHILDGNGIKKDVVNKLYTAIGARGTYRIDKLFELLNNTERTLTNKGEMR